MKNYTANINPKYLHSEVTAKILQGFYVVCSEIGHGFLFDFFRRALVAELESVGLKCEVDKAVKVSYKEVDIGEFTIDILVDGKVNVLLIRGEQIVREHEIILSNQLKLSDIEVGLILNIYIECEHRRRVYTNDLKKREIINTLK